MLRSFSRAVSTGFCCKKLCIALESSFVVLLTACCAQNLPARAERPSASDELILPERYLVE